MSALFFVCLFLMLLSARIMAEETSTSSFDPENLPTIVPDPSLTTEAANGGGISNSSNTTSSSIMAVSNHTSSSIMASSSTVPTSTPPVAIQPSIKCPRNKDTVIGYVWPPTSRSSKANQSCPSPFTGEVKRACTRNGTWLKPSFRECKANSTEGLFEALHSILGNMNETTEDALFFIRQLKNLTAPPSPSASGPGPQVGFGTPFLQPEDLKTVNLVCSSTLYVVDTDPDTVSDMFTLINNALDIRNQRAWEELQEKDQGSEELLSSAEMFAGLTAQGLARQEEVVRLSLENIAIKAMHIPMNRSTESAAATVEDPLFPMPADIANTSIPEDSFTCKMRLPSRYLKAVAGEAEAVSTAFVLFPTLQNFLPHYVLPENVTVASVILSAQVMGGNNSTDVQSVLSTDPVEMNFTMKIPFNDGLTSVTCVYWKFSSYFDLTTNTTSYGTWLSDGIVTEIIDNNTVRCLSSHLTNFAVLVDVSGTFGTEEANIPIFSYGNDVLYYISFVGCGLSILCLIATIIFLLSLGKEIFEKVHYFVHLNLSISLGIGLIIFMSGLNNAVPYAVLCRVVAASLHYFFLSAFCWMLCEAIMVFLLIVVVFTTVHKKWFVFMIIGWVPPLLIVGVTFGVFYDDYIEESTVCWLNDSNNIIWSFSGPMLLIVGINLLVMVTVFVQIYRSKKKLRRMSVKGTYKGNSATEQDKPHYTKRTIISMVRGIIVLLPLLGVTWIGGFFSLNEKTFILACISGMLNSFQGVFIFVFHVLFSQKGIAWFKKVIGKYRKVSAPTDSPSISLVSRRKTFDSSVE